MDPNNAKERLEEFIGSSGASFSSLSPSAGIELMLDFYRDERAEGCPLESDGDMLLYQWGTYDWGNGESFEFNITRQLICSDGEDDDIQQLSLTFKFVPTSLPSDLGEGNRWCQMPDELPAFRKFIEESPPYVALGQTRAAEVILEFAGV